MSFKVRQRDQGPYIPFSVQGTGRSESPRFAQRPRVQPTSARSLQSRQLQQRTPAQNLCQALDQGKSLEECFPLFQALDVKTRNVAYQILCNQFGSKTGDTKKDGIALFLEDPTRLLAPTSAGPRGIDHIISVADGVFPQARTSSARPLQSRQVQQQTPAQNLRQALEQGKSIEECFPLFQALDVKTRNVAYQILCNQFGSKSGDTKKDGIALFLEDHTRLLAPTSAGPRVIDYVMYTADGALSQVRRPEHSRSAPIQRQQHEVERPLQPRGSRAPRNVTNEDRIQIFRETLREIPKRLDPDTHQQMLAGTQLIQPALISTASQESYRTDIRVENCTTFEMTRKVVGAGFRPLVLDMANAYTPGGGVTKGSPVQEETLCRQSDLYLALEKMDREGSYPIPEHAGIFVPKVQFFRDDQYRFVEPFAADVFVSAAYDCNTRHHGGYDRPANDVDYLLGTSEKIRAMLRTAILNGNDSLVLGAFGCGAFDNNSRFIADLYLSILYEDEFRGRFRLVTFAVYDPPVAQKRNFPVFQRILQPSSRSPDSRRLDDQQQFSETRPGSRQVSDRRQQPVHSGSLYRFENMDRPVRRSPVRQVQYHEDVDSFPAQFAEQRGRTRQHDRVEDLPPPPTARPTRRSSRDQEDTKDDVPQGSFFSRLGSRIGGMFSSAPKKSPNELLIDFYQGKGPNSDGLMFEDILKWNDRQLENTGSFSHRYIQWLFPSWGESDFNKAAPVLSDAPHIAKQFRQDPVCMQNLERAFLRILKFYGLELDEDSMTISRIRGHRFHWIKPNDHNYRRITRILGCLSNMGLKTHAQAFLDILEDLAQKEGRRSISQKSLSVWRSAVH